VSNRGEWDEQVIMFVGDGALVLVLELGDTLPELLR